MIEYKIIRFYRNGNKKSKIIRQGFTLEQAQEWCSCDDTRKAGVWFDGYEEDKG